MLCVGDKAAATFDSAESMFLGPCHLFKQNFAFVSRRTAAVKLQDSNILGTHVSLRSEIKRQDGDGTPGGNAKPRFAQHTYRSTKSRTSIECGVYWNGGSCDSHCCYTAGVEVLSAKGVGTG